MSAGADLVGALAAARRAVQLYPPTHPTHIGALDALQRTVEASCESGAVALNLYQGRLYCGSDVIEADVPGATSMAEALEARGIESLTFESGFAPSDAVGLLETLGLRPSPELDVIEELDKRQVSHVAIAYLVDPEKQAATERDERREELRALYRQVVAAFKAMQEGLSTGGATSLAEAGTVADKVVAHLAQDRTAMLGLATLRSRGETSLFHGVNVMIYSLELGAELGLTDQELASLGVSALLHDIGKPSNGEGHSEQAQLVHPTAGAEVLAALAEEDGTPMLVAYEHHMRPDGAGYPRQTQGYVPHPYSRIVAIADRYENLTKGSNGNDALTPDRAIAVLLKETGTGLDPVYARLFVKVMGVFPIGCLVRLSDHSVGVVSEVGDQPLSPKVRLVYGPDGMPLTPPEEVDVSRDERTVVEVVDPEVLDVEVADHL